MAERSAPSDAPVRIAVLGAGMIGRQHAARVAQSPDAALRAIVDPAPASRGLAADLGAAWFPDLDAMLRAGRPDAVIVATPNDMHVPHGLACLEADIPVLVEKPLAADLAGAERLVAAAERRGVPLLVGHHRRHNPRLQAARHAIAGGRLGRVVAVHATTWFHKPEEYFAQRWRRQEGAGPVLLNLIHDLDTMRFLCGDVVEVQAMVSHAARGFAVEDTAGVLLRFRNGALGTLTVSDVIAAPWSWEFTSGENQAYSRTPEVTMMIGGTHASLAIPTLDVWAHRERPDWHTPIARTRLDVEEADPLARQIQNLCEVVRREAEPVVPGREGLLTLRLVHALQQSATTGLPQAA